MFTQPHIVLTEYLSGVRKRYVNPFGYLAVGAALSLIIFANATPSNNALLAVIIPVCLTLKLLELINEFCEESLISTPAVESDEVPI